MNTFIARGTDYLRGGRELDTKRLVKQLTECQQIYHALIPGGGPAHILHHPATQMWEGLLPQLLDYGIATYEAYRERFPGREHRSGELMILERQKYEGVFSPPDWVDDYAPYHRAKLYVKDPVHYAQYYERDPATSAPVYPITRDGRLCGWVYRRTDKDTSWCVTYRGTLGSHRYKTAWEAVQFVRQEE